MARKLERPAPAAVSSGWNASTTIIFVALFIASLNGYFAYHRISDNATALNAEVLRTRQLLALLNKHRSIVAPPPMPTIVSADRKTSISKGVTVMPAKPQLIHSGGSPADPILGGQVKKGVVAKKTPAPTLKPDLIGNRGRPIDDDLIDRIKDEIKRSDAERERQGRPWLKTRPNKENEAGPTPRLRIAIASLNARGVQKQGGPQGGHGGGGALNKRPDWQHRHAAHNKLEYCKKWGYDLIIEDNSIVDTSRDVAWSKIPLLRKWLPQYDYIMWMDMDAFFMRFDIPLEAFIRDETKDVVMAKDWHGINLGVFLIKNSDFSFQLLNDMWNVPRHMWEPWQEQSALMKLLDVQFSGSQAKARDAAFFYIEQRDMNAYPQHFAYGNAKAMYLDGDPIAHFPNCKAFPQCKSLIERFYTVSCKVNGLDVLGNDPIIPMRIVPILPEMKVYQGKKLRPTTPPPLAKADQGEDENPPTLKPTAAPPTKAKADDESAEESEAPPTPKPTKKPSPKKSKKPRTPAPPEDDNDEKE